MAKERATLTSKDVGQAKVGADGEPRIVEAAGTATGRSTPPQPKPDVGKTMGRAIEDAMNQAIQQASADGVSDPAEVKKRILEARERAAAHFNTTQEIDNPAPQPPEGEPSDEEKVAARLKEMQATVAAQNKR